MVQVHFLLQPTIPILYFALQSLHIVTEINICRNTIVTCSLLLEQNDTDWVSYTQQYFIQLIAGGWDVQDRWAIDHMRVSLLPGNMLEYIYHLVKEGEGPSGQLCNCIPTSNTIWTEQVLFISLGIGTSVCVNC